MQDLTEGSLIRHLLKTSSFMLVTMVFQTLYFLVDLYWVGRLGKEAVAAVGVAGNLTFMVLAMTQMLGVGTTALVSHAAGRKERDEAIEVFNQSQVLSIVAGGAFLVLALVLRPLYTSSLSADPLTAALASAYLLWFIPAMALQFGMVVMGAALRGTGNFKPGMVVQTSTVVLNMVLAPLLIFGWITPQPMGVAGAALASLVAVVVGTIWLAFYFRPASAYLQFTPRRWKPRFDVWARMLRIGLPAGAEFALMAVYLVIVYVVSRRFGAAAQAGFGIAMRVIQAAFLPVVALGFAVAPVAGQNFGAGRADRVRQTFRTGAVLAASIMLVVAALCYEAPASLMRAFTSDAQVTGFGVEYLRIVSWTFIASGVIFVASSTFQALGNTIPPLITSFSRLVIVAVPTILLSRLPDFELRWIWYLSAGSILVQLGLSLMLLQREFRVRLSFEPARTV